MMRTTKELLQLTLEFGEKHFERGDIKSITYRYGYKGLCGMISQMFIPHDLITETELITIATFIRHHRPKNTKGKLFFWPVGDWKPRQKWLKYHINKIKE